MVDNNNFSQEINEEIAAFLEKRKKSLLKYKIKEENKLIDVLMSLTKNELDDIRIAFVVSNREGDVLSQILRRQVLIAQTKLVWRAARHDENHDSCQKRIYFIYNLHKTNTLKS